MMSKPLLPFIVQCRVTLTNMSFMNERSLIAPYTAYCTGAVLSNSVSESSAYSVSV